MLTLTIIRGLPGSGKSTVARALKADLNWLPIHTLHYETDMYFTTPSGEYIFEGMKIGEAHEWCQEMVRNAIANGYNCIVSNTFTRVKEFQYCLDLAKEFNCKVQIIECRGTFGSIHGVPENVLNNMKTRWEEFSLPS